jgi:2-polyprenyl-3-methyl-5-hydroxy-6-metoxy-1,4-benzoquinol methylase
MHSGPELALPDQVETNEGHWAAYDAAGIDRLLAVEDRHFWFRARNQIIAALVRAPIRSLPEGFRILEVGCGSGNVLRVLKVVAADRGSVEGLEVSAPAAAAARTRTGLSVTNGYLADLDAPAPYDVIAAFDVLEHIKDEHAVLAEMRARLKDGGRVILTVPAHPTLWSAFDVASEHMRRYTLAGLTAALGKAGFEVEYLSYFMSLLYPAMWLRRHLLRADRDDLAAVYDSEFRIVPGINRVAYEILRQEAHVIRRGGRLPFGTSLAVIARTASSGSPRPAVRY